MGEVFELRKMLGDILLGDMLRRGDISFLYETKSAEEAREKAIMSANAAALPLFSTEVIPFRRHANRERSKGDMVLKERRAKC